MTQRFVVVDLETTGNSPKKGDRVIEFAAVTIENNTIVDTYATLLNPKQLIPPFITELTTITNEMVQNAPTFEEVAPVILEKLNGAVFVAHNVNFDLRFLQDALDEVGYAKPTPAVIDTVEFAKIVYPTADSYKLSELSDRHNLSHDQPHRAEDDAVVTAKLFMEMVKKTATFPIVTLEKLVELSYSLKSDLSLILEKVIEKKLEHVEQLDPTLEVYRGIALQKEDFQAEAVLRVEDYPATDEEKQAVLQKKWPSFEFRSGQFEMMDAVYSAVSSHQSLCVEAGTGVGKSLAYLLPLAYHTAKTQTQAIISTYTVPLQHQLVEKELAQVQELVPFPIPYSVLKGRSHYLSLLKFEQSLSDFDSPFDVALTKMQLLVWLLQTKTGDIDEVNLSSAGWVFWEKIKHSGWYQEKERDPWISRDFSIRAKKRAENAAIIVTNHAYLLRHDIPSSVQSLVIDEAHHLENAARNAAGVQWSYGSFKFMLGLLGRGEKSGYISELFTMKGKENAFKVDRAQMEEWLFELEQVGEELFSILASALTSKQKYGNYSKVSIGYKKVDESLQVAVQYAAERFLEIWTLLQNAVFAFLEDARLTTGQGSQQQVTIERIYGHVIEWEEKISLITDLAQKPTNSSKSIWFVGDKKALPNSIVIHEQPTEVESYLQETLFQKVASTVLTSATLTVKGSFSYVKEEWGFKEQTLVEKIIPSPYPYDQQARLYVPKDVPDIKEVSTYDYVEAITNTLIPLAQVTKGRMLLLFTSYDMLKKTYDLIKESGMLDEYALLAQGISGGSRGRLTKNFTKYDKAILFGTSSFWEGIDIPGEDLSCLVIVRLPFAPPDEPVMETKVEKGKQRGQNVFSSVSLPDAIITFKQGFGRLIRKSTDKGIVVVFDRRITTTSYGKAFLQSIPSLPVKEVSLNELLEETDEWLT